MVGSKISHYEIVEKLGEGGMGVVYKAKDTKLDRFVALKFLPAQFSSSEQDKSRFAQEARAASALNHPNVCTIHDILEHEGQMFIVMEFVDGQTLREKMPAVSVKQAIDIGIQVADGLAAAHEKGIVHRDIKPENIMVRRDGIVQIMDFGLAKLRSQADKATRLTKAGSTVGTAGYMSPEQVQGQDVDHRSDIFSFGVLLHELFTGHLPFKGVHETALLYEIVNVDPPPMSALKPEIDPVLDVVVAECIAKEPTERFQSAAEVAKELRRYKRESSRLSSTKAARVTAAHAVLQQSAIAPPAKSFRGERLVWIAGVLLLAGFAIYLFIGKLTQEKPASLAFRFFVYPPENTTIAFSTVSPDGKMIAFSATGGGKTLLWIRQLGALQAQPLPGTDEAEFPFWSPDGKSLGFFDDGKLKKIDPAGGPPVAICDGSGLGASWGADGEILFAKDESGLSRVSSAGGTPKSVTVLDSSNKESTHAWPTILPDGKHFLFTVMRVFDESVVTYVSSFDDTSRTPLLTSDANVCFVPPSGVLYLRNRTLMYQHLDLTNFKLTGDAKPVAFDVGYVPRLAIGDFSYSPAGILATGSGRSINRQFEWYSRAGQSLGSAGPPGNYFDIALSPNETMGAIQRVDVQTGNSDIWLLDVPRGLVSRLTFEPSVEDDPAWSADGKYVYYANTRDGSYNLYRKAANGTSMPEMLTPPSSSRRPMSISADGKCLLYEAVTAKTLSDIWVLPSDSTKPAYPYIAGEFNETDPKFSPDGKWVAYASDESGRYEIYVQSFPASGGRWQVSTGGGFQVLWRADGGELYYVAPDLKLMAVEVRPGATFEFGTAQPLFLTHIDNYGSPNRYAVAEKGKKFLINVPVGGEVANPITVSIQPLE